MPITAPERAAQATASVQFVSGSSGTVGGLAPVAPRQIAVMALSAAWAATTADSAASTFQSTAFIVVRPLTCCSAAPARPYPIVAYLDRPASSTPDRTGRVDRGSSHSDSSPTAG